MPDGPLTFAWTTKLLGESLPLPLRLSRDLVLWLVPTPRNHPQRPPASDLVLPPLSGGPQTTQLAVRRRLSRGHRRETSPNKQFLHASGRWTTWSWSARTPAYNSPSVQQTPAGDCTAALTQYDYATWTSTTSTDCCHTILCAVYNYTVSARRAHR